jgi:DNA (cytosine-5)-methyltransferase 1
MLTHATTQFGEIAGSLTARHDSSPCADRGMNVVAFDTTQITSKANRSRAEPGLSAGTLSKGSDMHVAVQPYTLAIRGRGDSHDLEYRTDGTANALLTPNGGRAGIGVGAIAFHPTQDPISSTDGSTHCMGTGSKQGCATVAVAFDTYNQTVNKHTSQTIKSPQGAVQESVGAVLQSMQVRRLTPRECERLQGFPDDYTLVPNRGKPAADGPRYKALGNSWAVPNVRWIGERIAAVAAIKGAA